MLFQLMRDRRNHSFGKCRRNAGFRHERVFVMWVLAAAGNAGGGTFGGNLDVSITKEAAAI